MPTVVRDTFDPEKGATVVEVPWSDVDDVTLADYVAAGDPDAAREWARRRANPVD